MEFVFARLMLCVAATFSLAMSTAAQQNNRSQTINAESLFTFRLPIGFKQTETGVDSFMRGYQRERARFIFVCGDSASSEYDEKSIRNLRENSTTLDGKHATVRTFTYKFPNASLYITELNVGNGLQAQKYQPERGGLIVDNNTGLIRLKLADTKSEERIMVDVSDSPAKGMLRDPKNTAWWISWRKSNLKICFIRVRSQNEAMD